MKNKIIYILTSDDIENGIFYKKKIDQLKQQNKRDNCYSMIELITIFPEAKPIIKLKIKEYRKQHHAIKIEIVNDLKKIYTKITDPFSIWFWEKYLEIFKGKKLEELTKNINRLKFVISPKTIQYKVTNEMIQKAKEHPFENLIEFNCAQKALCLFHNETHPSLSLNPKNNRIKCFGCGINLDTIGFIMKTQNFSFIEAVKYLTNY